MAAKGAPNLDEKNTDKKNDEEPEKDLEKPKDEAPSVQEGGKL